MNPPDRFAPEPPAPPPQTEPVRGRRGRRSFPRAASSGGSGGLVLADDDPIAVAADDFTGAGDGEISGYNPRTFTYAVKQKCWGKAEVVRGRDPERWRRDAGGNLVFRKLVGCAGCFCYDYDHIVPYSKGGKSTLENCQVLQASVNRSKGNKTDISRSDLVQRNAFCRVTGRDMDMLEISAYGNIRRGPDTGGCWIQ